MSHRLLIKNGWIITFGEPCRVLRGHAIAVEGTRIRRIAPMADFEGESFDEVIDADGAVVLPGFINAHMHCYSALVTGLSPIRPAANFVEVLRHLWWRWDRTLTLEDCYISTLVACIQAIRRGTTTLIDHHASPMAVSGSLNQVARAVEEAGLRASLCYEVSDRDGPAVAEAGIEENRLFLQRIRNQGQGRLHGLFGLHAAFTIGGRTMARAVEAAQSQEAGFHIHVAEDAADQDHARAEGGQRVVERLHRAGVLGPKTICAHCVHLDPREIDLLAETHTMVTHQPQSNMNNGVGVMNLPAFLERNVLVGLGTDAMTLNMLEELRTGLWLQKLHSGNPSGGFQELMKTFGNNAAIAARLWREPLGELRPGYKADVVLMNYDPATPLTEENYGGHLVFGLSQASVRTTVVDGRVLMRDGVLTTLDEAAVMKQARLRARFLWQRFHDL